MAVMMTASPRPVQAEPQSKAFNSFLEAVGPAAGIDAATLYTTLPRGGLQVCRTIGRMPLPGDVDLAWKGLLKGEAAGESLIAVRIEGPLFGGYPGVLVLRHQEDVADLADVAATVRNAYADYFTVRHDAPLRQAILAGSKTLYPNNLADGFGETVASKLPGIAAGDTEGGRQSIVDADGTHVPVSAVRYDEYPALSDGPVTFVSLAPRVEDWQALRPDDFSADTELARLSTAVRFIVAEFRRGPTLQEVADSVGLSPFHFHRRFSERFGLTPKHLLYDLQLDEAKKLLADPRKPLTEIAETCGFAHQSHFTSRFKQGTGLTPTRWRRQVTHA